MSSAIGYENEDGTVNYVIAAETTLDELLVKYISKRTVPTSLTGATVPRKTVDDYFSTCNQNGVCQNCSSHMHWLILYKLDSTTICKKPGTAGVLIYKS
jgi:hypothetical protein